MVSCLEQNFFFSLSNECIPYSLSICCCWFARRSCGPSIDSCPFFNLTKDIMFLVPCWCLTKHSHFVQDEVFSFNGQFALSDSWHSDLCLWDLSTSVTSPIDDSLSPQWWLWWLYSSVNGDYRVFLSIDVMAKVVSLPPSLSRWLSLQSLASIACF